MRRIINWLPLVAAFVLLMGAQPSSAQATRTWVSGVGDDANPCSRTAPCKTFAGAISKTAAAGEINVLDPGGFGGVTITKSISILSRGNIAGVLVSGTNGVVINALPTDRVILDGLDIEGLGSGLSGINILNAGQVLVKNTTIRNFRGTPGNGINLQSAARAEVHVEDSTITGNKVGVAVTNSAIFNKVHIENSYVVGNVDASLKTDGSLARAAINGSTLRGATLDLSPVNGGTISSFGTNNVGSGAPNDPNPPALE